MDRWSLRKRIIKKILGNFCLEIFDNSPSRAFKDEKTSREEPSKSKEFETESISKSSCQFRDEQAAIINSLPMSYQSSNKVSNYESANEEFHDATTFSDASLVTSSELDTTKGHEEILVENWNAQSETEICKIKQKIPSSLGDPLGITKSPKSCAGKARLKSVLSSSVPKTGRSFIEPAHNVLSSPAGQSERRRRMDTVLSLPVLELDEEITMDPGLSTPAVEIDSRGFMKRLNSSPVLREREKTQSVLLSSKDMRVPRELVIPSPAQEIGIRNGSMSPPVSSSVLEIGRRDSRDNLESMFEILNISEEFFLGKDSTVGEEIDMSIDETRTLSRRLAGTARNSTVNRVSYLKSQEAPGIMHKKLLKLLQAKGGGPLLKNQDHSGNEVERRSSSLQPRRQGFKPRLSRFGVEARLSAWRESRGDSLRIYD